MPVKATEVAPAALTVSMEAPPAPTEAGCGVTETVGMEAGVSLTCPPPQPRATRRMEAQESRSAAESTRGIEAHIRNVITKAIFTLSAGFYR